MNLENMSLLELKAMAYDFLAKIQAEQRNLEIVNAQIQKKNAAEQRSREIVNDNQIENKNQG